MGRRLKLTKQTQEDVCAALAIGCTYVAAAENADISYSTMRLWISLGEKARGVTETGAKLPKEDVKYLAFLEAVEGAKAQALLKWQQTVDRAADSDPAWAWKMLQVRAPEEYTPPQKVEVGGKDGRDIVLRVVYGNDGTDNQPD